MAYFQRQAVGRLVEPAGDRRVFSERGCFAGQDEKGRLKNVLRIRGLRQHAAGDAPDQAAVPGDQRGKGAAIAISGPAGEKLAIRVNTGGGPR